MENIFLKILNISITASWLVLAVLLMRLLLKKAPKWLSVVMWALVGIRLMLPFSFESALSLIPSIETVPPEIIYEQAPQIHTGFDVINSAVNPVISESFAPAPGASVNPLQVITYLAGWIWVIGMVAMAVYTLISCLRIRRKLREAAPLRENIYLCDRIDTPFIFGLFRPRIYLPSVMAGADIPYVLAHENAHLKRRDHLWKPLGFLLLTVYWFNPLLWLAYILLCRDIEAACDEKVLSSMGDEVKKPYSTALVNCSVPRKMIAACPLAFGEVNVKSRIKNVLSYKKPAFWLLIAAVVVCIVLSVCFLTNPRTVNEQMQVFLDCQIAEHFQTEKSQGNACCLDYEILGTKKRGKTTTVYMWVLYEEYSYQKGQLQQETGSHIPTVITARKEDGNYRLVEYFEPRDGTYNPEDIKAKFPWYLWPKAMDSQRYIKRQKQACQELAEQYFKENPPATEETLQPLAALREKYPEYFDLPTNNGLEVYVWQMSQESYYWGLLPGRAVDYYETTLLDLKGASLEEICAIVASYNLDSNQITVHPFLMPYSSYYYVIDEVYTHNVTTLFWSRMYAGTQPSVLESLHGPIDAVDYDIDSDGVTEHCQLHYGPTSGLFTFGVVAYENGQPEYCNLFLSDWGLLSFVEKDDGSLGVQRDGRSQEAGMEIYHIVVADGHIQLIGDVTALEYWGPQGPDPVMYDDWGLRMRLFWEDGNVVNAVFEYEPTTSQAGFPSTTSEYTLYVIHEGKRWPFEDYVRKVLGQDYPAPEPVTQLTTYTITAGESTVVPVFLDYWGMDLPAGTYELTKEVHLQIGDTRYRREYSARFAIVEEAAYPNTDYQADKQKIEATIQDLQQQYDALVDILETLDADSSSDAEDFRAITEAEKQRIEEEIAALQQQYEALRNP